MTLSLSLSGPFSRFASAALAHLDLHLLLLSYYYFNSRGGTESF